MKIKVTIVSAGMNPIWSKSWFRRDFESSLLMIPLKNIKYKLIATTGALVFGFFFNLAFNLPCVVTQTIGISKGLVDSLNIFKLIVS